MANSLWVGAVRTGLSTARPTIPDASDDTFQFYHESDTGKIKIGLAGGSGWFDTDNEVQPTPTAETATATLTIAELLTKIITVTSAVAVTLTLPLGTLTDAGLESGALAADQSFDWYVINLGSASGAVTMAGDTGHTYVGNTGVPISTSAHFRTRKTADDTFVTYRIG